MNTDKMKEWQEDEMVVGGVAMLVAGILLVVLVVLLVIQIVRPDLLFGLPPDTAFNNYIAVLTSDVFDVAGAGQKEHTGQQIVIEAIRTVVPLKNNDVVYRNMAKRVDVLQHVQDLYAKGSRVFIGYFTSKELQLVKQFAADHSDVAFVSTASTQDELALPDNIFRLSDTDSKLIEWLPVAVMKAMPRVKTLRVFYDTSDSWATSFVQKLKASTQTAVVVDVQDPTKPAVVLADPSVLNVILFVEGTDNLNSSTGTTSVQQGANFLFGDSYLFGDLSSWKDILTDMGKNAVAPNVYSIGSYHSWSTSWFAQTKLKVQPTPFVSNMLTAVWMAFDMLQGMKNGRCKTPSEYLASAQGPDNVGYFDKNGDPASSELMLAKWNGIAWHAAVQTGVSLSNGSYVTEY